MKYYFSFDELTHTDTGICNSIPIAETNPILHNLVILRTVLNVIRGLVGRPIVVTSAFRSREVNAAVGGVPTSNHCLGRAADIAYDSGACSDLYKICKQLYNQGVLSEFICYPDKNYIHIAI